MSDSPRMKITDVRLVKTKVVKEIGEIEPAWDVGGRLHFAVGGRSFTEVHTDEGLVGIGPAFDEQYLDGIKAQLVGKDPFSIEEHVARLRYFGYAPRHGRVFARQSIEGIKEFISR